MTMYSFPHMQIKSATKWSSHGLIEPTGWHTFSSTKKNLDNLCPCVFQSGYLFHWQMESRYFFYFDLLCFNDLVAEEVMWYYFDLLKNLKNLAIAENKDAKLRGAQLQITYRNIDQINSISWPDRDNNEATLLLHLNHTWNKLPPGSFKLPWYLLPSCNLSLRLWLQAELLNTYFAQLRAEGQHFTAVELLNIQLYSVFLMKKAAEAGKNCSETFQTYLNNDLKKRKVKAFVWVAQQDSFKTDYAARELILRAANNLVLELEKVPGGIEPTLAEKVHDLAKTAEADSTYIASAAGYGQDISQAEKYLIKPTPLPEYETAFLLNATIFKI